MTDEQAVPRGRPTWRPGEFAVAYLESGVTRYSGVCPPEYEGGPGVAHGGWIAAFFDDLLGRCVNGEGPASLTGELSVRFVKPVPVGPQLVGAARVRRREGRRRYVTGELELASSGALLATAHGVFIDAHADHFQRTAAWVREQEEQVSADRLEPAQKERNGR